MRLKIERMNHTGEGITSYKGITFFVKNTLPGDIIEVDTKDIIHHKNYNQLLKYKLITPSKNRVESPCIYSKECGGCQLMNISYEKQLEYKKDKIINIFKKYVQLDINPEIFKTKPYHYRNKITLQVQNKTIGLYSKNSKTLIPINNCLLIPNKLNELIPILNNLNLTKVTKIILKIMNKKIMIQFLGKINKDEVIELLSKKVSSIYLKDELIYGIPYLEEELPPYTFNVSPESFFQINHEGTILLYNKVKEYLGQSNNHVLDLYCGTGTIGIYISQNCKKITGIELNHSSAQDAKRNIEKNSLKNIKILEGDVGTLLKEGVKYDAIIVDPPRSGLDKKTKQTLLKLKSPKIIYISCDPLTLARDINILKESYNLEQISLIDMFPNSYHCESITLLKLKYK